MEYFEVLEGNLYVQVGSGRVLLTPSNDELPVQPYVRNRVIPGPLSTNQKVTKFLMPGPAAEGDRMLDYIAYENFYRYMDTMVSAGNPIELVQILCMFDAGGGLLHCASMVYTFQHVYFQGYGCCDWEMVGCDLGISAVLPGVDHRLGNGRSKNEKLHFPESLCYALRMAKI